MRSLDNPDENPCFGCGPGHERALELSFARDKDEVGWPWRARRTAHALAG